MKNILHKLLKVLPRHALDDLAKGYGNEAPWHSNRSDLEKLLVSKDCEELRYEVLAIIKTKLIGHK